MKKLLLTAVALSCFVSASAYAEVNVNVDLGLPGVQEAPSAPVYIAPSPVVVEQRPLVVGDHHREQDRRYWAERKAREDRERREREAREHHDHHDDRRGDHHDNHQEHGHADSHAHDHDHDDHR